MDITTPTTPTFVAAPEPQAEHTEPLVPLTDDIPEVPVSAAVAAAIQSMPPGPVLPPDAMLNQFCATLEGKIGQWVAEQSLSTVKVLDAVLVKMVECLEKASGVNEHAQYQLSNTLEKLLGQGMQIRGAPYTVELQARTPQGYAVTFRLTKESAQDLAQATEAVVGWMQQAGYTVPMGGVPPLTEAEGLPF